MIILLSTIYQDTVSFLLHYVASFIQLWILLMVNKPEELNQALHLDNSLIMGATHFQSLSSFSEFVKQLN